MPLDPVPALDALASTRHSWHLLAAHVVAEERYRRVGHSGLQPTRDGFRTAPDEPAGVEVARDRLLRRRGDEVTDRAITTIGDAQTWVLGELGYPRWAEQPGLHDPPEPVAPQTALEIDPAVASWLGGWLHLGFGALTALVADTASIDAGGTDAVARTLRRRHRTARRGPPRLLRRVAG